MSEDGLWRGSRPSRHWHMALSGFGGCKPQAALQASAWSLYITSSSLAMKSLISGTARRPEIVVGLAIICSDSSEATFSKCIFEKRLSAARAASSPRERECAPKD
ncbi:unnamed protein product [Symbiodinium natans]|uniref:Uncharacterized protein n=1 Tax=Symbiodinium natans TaxID=878477 RepID=A0A812JR22_9DINO|nr:unnamed protein product [Symbiodinium natans]